MSTWMMGRRIGRPIEVMKWCAVDYRWLVMRGEVIRGTSLRLPFRLKSQVLEQM